MGIITWVKLEGKYCTQIINDSPGSSLSSPDDGLAVSLIVITPQMNASIHGAPPP